jgi:hypothetical protein
MLVLPVVTHHVNIDVNLAQYQIESLLKVIITAAHPYLLPLLFLPPVASISVVSVFPPSFIKVILVIVATVVANVRLPSGQLLHRWKCSHVTLPLDALLQERNKPPWGQFRHVTLKRPCNYIALSLS